MLLSILIHVSFSVRSLMWVFLCVCLCVCQVFEPTTSTPSPRKILDFHVTISKSTQDLGFFKNHTRVSRIFAGTFQVLLFRFTNAPIRSQIRSKRQNFRSIALDHSQNFKKYIFFRAIAAFTRSCQDLGSPRAGSCTGWVCALVFVEFKSKFLRVDVMWACLYKRSKVVCF